MCEVKISVCQLDDQRAALELVLSAVPADQRSTVVEGLRPLAEQGVNVFSALVTAKSGSMVVGAAWLQPQVGRTGTLWPSQVSIGASPLQRGDGGTAGAPGSLKRDLARVALEVAKGLPVDLVQTILETPDDPFVRDLIALGFTQLAELLYLMLDVPKQTERTEIDCRLRLASPATSNLGLLERLLVGSYEGTQDCPALEGLRKFADTIAGYQAVGAFDESLWFVAHWEDQPAGLMLLASYPGVSQWELVYMGVIPEFRGLGIGGLMLEDMHRRAAEAQVEQIVLAVDAANQPARRIYAAAGYTEWSRRTAFLRSLVESCEG